MEHGVDILWKDTNQTSIFYHLNCHFHYTADRWWNSEM